MLSKSCICVFVTQNELQHTLWKRMIVFIGTIFPPDSILDSQENSNPITFSDGKRIYGFPHKLEKLHYALIQLMANAPTY